MKKSSIFASLLITSSLAIAVTDSGERQISSFGMQGGGASALSYITVAPIQSANCLYGVIYIHNATENGSKMLTAAALTAYASSKSVKRIDYDIKSDGTCSLTLLNF